MTFKVLFKQGRVEPITIYFGSEPLLSLVKEAGEVHSPSKMSKRLEIPSLHNVPPLRTDLGVFQSDSCGCSRAVGCNNHLSSQL